MRSVFVETGNVTAFRRAVLAVEDTERGQPGIVVAWGQAGRGKTFQPATVTPSAAESFSRPGKA